MAWHHRALWSLPLPVALATIVTGISTEPAKAVTNYPYCMKVYVVGGPYEDCSYSTYAQCQASASGRSALCYRDPIYPGPPGSAYVTRPPRYPYSPFGSNIDPNYDPYRGWAQQGAPAPQPHHKRHYKKNKQ